MDRSHLTTILSQSLPGSTLLDIEALGTRTYLLRLGDGRRVVLRTSASPDAWAGDPVRAEVAALRVLQGEIDLPIPTVLGDGMDGDGFPFAFLSYLEGVPLAQVIDQLSPNDMYAIGRELGHLMGRVHSYTSATYGSLDQTHHWKRDNEAPAPMPDKRGKQRPSPTIHVSSPHEGKDIAYLHGRLQQAFDRQTLDPDLVNLLEAWMATPLPTTARPAVLTHGDVQPECILVRRRDAGWRLAGVVGWGFAQAWRPAWDHTIFLAATADPGNGTPWHYFDLRTGYGTTYDDATERRYDQVRDLALLPYRLCFFLEAGRTDLVYGLLAKVSRI